MNNELVINCCPKCGCKADLNIASISPKYGKVATAYSVYCYNEDSGCSHEYFFFEDKREAFSKWREVNNE